ncbi:hypothetical protein I551_9035 [Mycobacterium ulcerans str. Harvey]|uniref:Uncharacterized protein n=1 Tax=Mycobacterium ulcerans str. Harvey TaxID=1299332 RepID=A0ABN0R9Z9_MYCUL|nr:hypothetical protein I551_9035 [Mycobacterium ulcerans str. Harvey]
MLTAPVVVDPEGTVLITGGTGTLVPCSPSIWFLPMVSGICC